MYAPETREVYVDLPEQDSEPGMCGILNMSMYGTRGAAQSWEAHYGTIFVNELKFKQGVASVCCFHHEERDIRVVVHGDDFTALCTREQCDWLTAQLKSHFELKVSGRLGSDSDDDKAVRILNRTVRWTDEGILYESDSRHAEIVVKQLGLDGSKGCKSVTTPGVKEAIPEVNQAIASQRASLYRSLVMRCAYLAQDRGDLQFSTKELARSMSEPTEHSWDQLKRVGRYLLGRPRIELVYKWQRCPSGLNCYVDSDFAVVLGHAKAPMEVR